MDAPSLACIQESIVPRTTLQSHLVQRLEPPGKMTKISTKTDLTPCQTEPLAPLSLHDGVPLPGILFTPGRHTPRRPTYLPDVLLQRTSTKVPAVVKQLTVVNE